MLTINTNKPYRIYAEHLEQGALDQFESAMNCNFAVQGALMPDSHFGYSLPIGAVVATKGVIVPAWVGYDIGCLDRDTEYLSESGWCKISKYKSGNILQFDPKTDCASFVKPIRHIAKKSKGFYRLFQKDGLDQLVSATHKILFYHRLNTGKHAPRDYLASAIVTKHYSLVKGLQGGVKTTFKLKSAGLKLSAAIIRVLVMVSADGCIRKRGAVELHLKKERKIARACALLKAARIPYKTTRGAYGTTYIYFSDARIQSKELNLFWGCSRQQLAIIAEESLLWDGHKGKHKFYSTKNKENADLIQYAFACNGVRCGIHTVSYPDKPNWADTYTVYLTHNEYVGLAAPAGSKQPTLEPSVDGKEYCFTVPSGYFVARRNNKVFITGNCGMCAVKTTFSADAVRANAKQIFDSIYGTVPVGFSHHKTKRVWEHAHQATETTKAIFDRDGLNQLGTLGGGNHFIEIGEDTEANIWIIVHSGSRGIGHAVATHYMRLASGDAKAREGHFGLDVTSHEGINYIDDLWFCLHFALENRRQLIQQVSDVMAKTVSGCSLPDTLINRNHNHAEPVGDTWVHRKGATHAESGMMGVIPGNMRDGSFIVRGKGCIDSLCSSSHGAGRVLGRKEAQRVLNMETFSTSMSGVTAKIDQSTLDESPLAYKNIFEVLAQQEDLVEVVTHVKPIINIKG